LELARLAWGVGDFAFADAVEFLQRHCCARACRAFAFRAAIHDFTSDAMPTHSDFTPKLKLLAGAVRAEGYDLAADVLRKRLTVVGFEREFRRAFCSDQISSTARSDKEMCSIWQPTNCSKTVCDYGSPRRGTPPAQAVRSDRGHPLR